MNDQQESKRTILLVDDDRLILSSLSSCLKSANFNVSTAESVDEAEVWLDHNIQPDLVLLDFSMPERPGIELSTKLKEKDNTPFIMLSAYSEKETINLASEAGAIGYLVKPVNISQVLPAIETAISRNQDLKKLRKSSDMLQTALDSDRAVSVAIGILMEKHTLSNKDAFENIRTHARSNHRKLIDVANEIIKASEVLTDVIVRKKTKLNKA